MKRVSLSEVKDDLSKYLRQAEKETIIITRHGNPAGVLVGFKSEDDWFDFRLENDRRFFDRIEKARKSLQKNLKRNPNQRKRKNNYFFLSIFF